MSDSLRRQMLKNVRILYGNRLSSAATSFFPERSRWNLQQRGDSADSAVLVKTRSRRLLTEGRLFFKANRNGQ